MLFTTGSDFTDPALHAKVFPQTRIGPDTTRKRGRDFSPPPGGKKAMCESNVYLRTSASEELVMENVAAITPMGDNRFLLRGLLGERKEVQGRIEDINLMGHRIVIAALE
jgi:predicted RNA-binding protein